MKETADSQKMTTLIWVCYTFLLGYWIARLWSNFPACMDTLEYVFPEKWFNVESYQKGLIPLWNPYIACGTPHLANFQSAPFYPLFWIWNFTGLTHWFFLVALAHEALAVAGFYFWLRSLKVRSNIAALCAWSWGGSAYLVLLWGFPTHLASLTWMPWIFWATQRAGDKSSVNRWLTLCAFWTLQLLAGYPIFSFYLLIFWTIYIWFGSKGDRWKVLFFSSAFILALGCTCCQWLPFLDLLGYMHREIAGSSVYQLKWNELLTLFAPNVLGEPGTTSYQGDYGNFIFGNFYLGLVPLVILAVSFWGWKVRLNIWQKSLIFVVFLPLGVHFFLWRIFPEAWLEHLEISKTSFLFPFCAMTVVALYANETMEQKKNKKWLGAYGWILFVIWVLDIALVPFRIVHPVPDPYQDTEVKRTVERVKELVGDGRILSVRDEDAVYSSAVTDHAGSFRETAERMTQNTNVVWGVPSAQAHLTTVVDGYQNLSSYIRKGYPYDGRVLDAAGVKLLIADKALPGFKYGLHESQKEWQLIRNAGAMPGGWLTDRATIVGDRAQSFGHLLAPKAFLEEECWLDQDKKGQATDLAPVTSMTCSEAGSPCAFIFHIPAGHSRYFILDQSFAPGWHAWVDGQAKPVLRANGFWMAVELQPGAAHEVQYQYTPISFRLGMFFSLLSLAGVAILFLIYSTIQL